MKMLSLSSRSLAKFLKRALRNYFGLEQFFTRTIPWLPSGLMITMPFWDALGPNYHFLPKCFKLGRQNKN